jgi:hypothetical protein
LRRIVHLPMPCQRSIKISPVIHWQ